MGKAIPDRWLDYQPIGQCIPSTRFIAFKVPLRQNINETVEEEHRLAPHSLLESVPNLGLIVDLTNTDRYYNPQTFRDQNVEHQKLMIPGHKTPPRALAQKFCDYVTNFLDANADNDKLIGVHCTHGVNRTGYLICYFMITKMNMIPKLAIQTFENARGHHIERENYTTSLMQLKAVKAAEKTKEGWPRQFNKTKDDQKQQQRYQNQYQDRYYGQNERGQQQQRHRQQHDVDQDRNYGRQRGRQQPQLEQSQQHQQSWRGNETRRYEPYNRKNSYNVSFNEKQTNWQTSRPRAHWQRVQNEQDHDHNQGNRRYNSHCNDRNYSRSNNCRPYNNYNRPEERRSHIRFNDE